MVTVPFTRDEVILALDALWFSGQERLSPTNSAIVELSALLNELPIIPIKRRGESFRSCTGISQQINSFRREYAKGVKDPNVGAVFYVVANEFREREREVHLIAEAIRRNRGFFSAVPFVDETEASDFPEGTLLEYLHKVVEQRGNKKYPPALICDICKLDLSEVYKPIVGGFMQMHLAVPITQLASDKEYRPDDFITVCPNCHAVLHRYRPWANKKTASKILR